MWVSCIDDSVVVEFLEPVNCVAKEAIVDSRNVKHVVVGADGEHIHTWSARKFLGRFVIH